MHVRVWFPHLTEADAKALGYKSSADASPGLALSGAWQEALAGVVGSKGSGGGSSGSGGSLQGQPALRVR